jgi:glycosyltransferase involved in cell wall biosynthesis
LRAVSLNVLHVDTERGWRGGERQTLWLAKELAARGHGSIIAARDGEPLAMRAAEAGIKTVRCAPRFEGDLAAAWRLRRAIRARSVDIVHAHTAHAVATAALATLRLDVPIVVSRRVDFKLRGNAATRWKYGRAAMIVAISRAVAQVLVASGVDERRVRVIPDGVDIHRVVTPADSTTLTALGVETGAPLVVQVAQLVGHKDPLNFVRAVARARSDVPNLQALLIGDGPLRGDVENEVRSLGLESTLHVAGYRTDADELLAAADVACLSSREEGMGSVLLDALAFGRPVAATTAGGIPEVIEHGETGLLVERENPVGLGDAIAELLTDRVLAVRLGANGRARARDFSVERMTDRTIAVYEEVLNGRGGGRRSRTDPASSANSSSVTAAP